MRTNGQLIRKFAASARNRTVCIEFHDLRHSIYGKIVTINLYSLQYFSNNFYV